jgi:hypothetical protein
MCCHLLARDRASSFLIFSGMESNGFNAPQCCGGVAAFHHRGRAFVRATNESRGPLEVRPYGPYAVACPDQ